MLLAKQALPSLCLLYSASAEGARVEYNPSDLQFIFELRNADWFISTSINFQMKTQSVDCFSKLNIIRVADFHSKIYFVYDHGCENRVE